MDERDETGKAGDSALLGCVEQFAQLRAQDPELSPRRFGERFPEALRDEVQARCLAWLLFGATTRNRLPPTAASAPIPQQLGDFRLLREIGRGGMGVVFLAEQISLGRRVALKILPPHPGLSARSVEHFRREASAMARLQHPGIVEVHTVGEVHGIHFLAMDYVEGTSLREHLDALAAGAAAGAPRAETSLGILPGRGYVAEVAELCARVAEALHYAHQQGVIHRDVKPQNILLSRAGEVRLVDFGLAKNLELDALTVSGEIKGTPVYMSPEQAQGRHAVLDHRTDQFSLGVVLYELLARRRPFAGADLHEVVQEIALREPEPIRKWRPQVPRDLVTICMKAMEKAPARRYATAGAMAEDLRRFLRLEPIHAVPAGPVVRAGKWLRRHRPVALTAGLALAALVALIISALVRQADVRAQVRGELAAAERAKDEDRIEDAVAHMDRASLLLPDDPLIRAKRAAWRELRRNLADWAEGMRLVSSAMSALPTHPAQALLVAIEAARRAPERLAESPLVNDVLLAALRACRETRTLVGHQEAVLCAAFHPRRPLVATASADWTARIWHQASGQVLHVLREHRGEVCWVAFDPDGELLVTASEDGTARVYGFGEERARLVLRGHEGPVRQAVLGPGGRRVATASDDGTVRVWDAASGACVLLLGPFGGAVRSVGFSPDGSRLVSGCADEEVRVHEVATGRCVWEQNRYQKVDRNRDPGPFPVLAARFTADGRRVLFTQGTAAFLRDLEANTETAKFTERDAVIGTAASADGRRVATTTPSRTVNVWNVGAERPSLQLQGHEQDVVTAAFDATGQLLVTASRDGTARIWDVAEDRSADVPRRLGPEIEAVATSPDGKLLAAASRSQGSVRLFDLDTGTLLTEARVDGCRLMPPLAFAPAGDVLLLAADDGTVRQLSWPADTWTTLGERGAAVCSLAFAPGGRRWATCATDGEVVLRDWPQAGAGRRIRAEKVRRISFHREGTLLLGEPFRHHWSQQTDTGSAPLLLWDLEREAPPREVRMASIEAALSAEGRRLLVAMQGAAVLRDLATDQEVPLDAQGWVQHAAFSTDGRLALATDRNLGQVFDAATGRLTATLRGHENALTWVDFTPDGARVVTASLDGTVRLWSPATEAEVCTLREPDVAMHWVGVDPRGRWVIALGGDGQARLWPARPLELCTARRPRDLNAAERDRLDLWTPAEREALALVERLFTTHLVQAEVVDQLRRETGVAAPVRDAALRMAGERPDRPWVLARQAWQVVCGPQSEPQALQRALRRAQAAHRLVPDHGSFRLVLGAALYRAGRDAEALTHLESLVLADHDPHAADAQAFLAMVCIRAGQVDAARAALTRMDALAQRPGNPGTATLRAEARGAVR